MIVMQKYEKMRFLESLTHFRVENKSIVFNMVSNVVFVSIKNQGVLCKAFTFELLWTYSYGIGAYLSHFSPYIKHAKRNYIGGAR